MSDQMLDIRLVVAPGLEATLAAEAQAAGFDVGDLDTGGVQLRGAWQDVWRANLALRGAGRVLVRLYAFRAVHLAQLDKRARKLPWAEALRSDVPVRIEASCKGSRIYHAGAVRQRLEAAITDTLGASISPDAPVRLIARIEDDLCTISVDTSGAPLHQRGHKEAVGKAPLRETFAALFLREAGFDGKEAVLDPMCGSGTFLLEAAAWSAGLLPGRTRGFAFEHLPSYDAGAVARLHAVSPKPTPPLWGSDRDAGAIRMATANAARAGFADAIALSCAPLSDLARPDCAPGLVITNPPYGARIGNKKALFGLYGAFGEVMRKRFAGWRVALVTSEPGLAKATGLPFKGTSAPVSNGGITVKLYQTGAL